ncbi:membrane protein [Rhodococcoides fascians]|uniref:membrane protein n=1 Tax=Rhodococcoides fascians TaxID=1828 RepID=UPI00055F7379|nr:membrane protein [Rhodococcus fascians]
MSENPPNGPQDGKDNNPEQSGHPGSSTPPGNYPPPPGNYPPPPGNYPPPPGNYPPPPGSYPPPPGNYPPPSGAYPPPPGNYPPPPGSYPPPPGNYPPPPGNYPPSPGYGGQGYGGHGVGLPPTLNVGDALSFGWNKFKDNAGVWIGIVVIAAVVQVILNLVFGRSGNSGDVSALFGIWSIIGTVVSAIVGYIINAAFIRGALHEVDGNKPAIGSFFQFANVASIIIASVLVAIMVLVGFVLLVIPGLVLTFLSWWTLQFVIDRNEDAVAAIKSSFRAISSNAGQLFLLALAIIGINILGAIPCFLGLLVTIPISAIASTYAYRIVSRTAAV